MKNLCLHSQLPLQPQSLRLTGLGLLCKDGGGTHG
jgi:hypothetical protein